MLSGYGAVWVDAGSAESQNEFAGVVLVAAKHGDVELAEGDFAASEDPRFVILAHPVEDSIRKSTGYTWNQLLLQGRYVRVLNCTCRECGTIFSRRCIAAPPAAGCLTGLVVGIALVVFFEIWTRSFFVDLTAPFLLAIFIPAAISVAAKFYYQWSFPDRVAALKKESVCPRCGSHKARSVGTSKLTICPRCRTKSMQLRTVGIS